MAAPTISATRVILEGGNGTSATLNAPTREANNGLLVTIWLQNTGASPSTPSGWTQLASVSRGTVFKQVFYGRIANNTATDNFSSSWTGSTFRFGEMRRIIGNTTTLANWIIGTGSNGTGTVLTVNGVTTVSTENLLIANWGTAEEPAAFASFTEGWTDDEAFWVPVFTKTQILAGASGNFQITFTGAGEDWVGLMIAVPPVVAASGGNPLTMVV